MKIWDLSTRLYHWLQALLVVLLVITGNSGEGPHVDLGIALAILVLWRILWGFWGSETNRFSQFLRSPLQAVKYLLGKVDAGVGHNPAGGWMVFVMLVVLLGQCLSGFALAGFLDYLPGSEIWLTDELFSLLEDMHIIGVDVLLALVALHLVAILIYKLGNKPLVWAMVSGVQQGEQGRRAPYLVSQWRALLILLLVAVLIMALVSLSWE